MCGGPCRRAVKRQPPAASDAPASTSGFIPTGSLHFAGRFELQPVQRRLLVDGEPAALGSRAFDLLLVLAEQPGTLLTKNQLLDRVWPGLVVEEGNLDTQISALRKVLGGDVIATIPGRGYRFTARIEAGGSATATATATDTAAAAVASPALPTPQPAAPPPQAAKLQTNLPATLRHLVGRAEDTAALGRHRRSLESGGRH